MRAAIIHPLLTMPLTQSARQLSAVMSNRGLCHENTWEDMAEQRCLYMCSTSSYNVSMARPIVFPFKKQRALYAYNHCPRHNMSGRYTTEPILSSLSFLRPTFAF